MARSSVYRRTGFILWLIAMAMTLAQGASAARVEGALLGVFPGNDSAAQLATDLGVPSGDVTLLAKVDIGAFPPDPASADGLMLSNYILDGDNEAISGWWDYTGVGTVTVLVVKAGPQYAAYEYTSLLTGGMMNMGLWDTSDLADKGVSHVSAYSVIPEPASALLVGLGLLGLAARSRR